MLRGAGGLGDLLVEAYGGRGRVGWSEVVGGAVCYVHFYRRSGHVKWGDNVPRHFVDEQDNKGGRGGMMRDRESGQERGPKGGERGGGERGTVGRRRRGGCGGVWEEEVERPRRKRVVRNGDRHSRSHGDCFLWAQWSVVCSVDVMCAETYFMPQMVSFIMLYLTGDVVPGLAALDGWEYFELYETHAHNQAL
ncbi:hypothetical protein Tco_0709838 [Tanacetum coccineum]